MDEKVFSVGQILGLVYHFQKSRSHKAKPGLDRFRLTFLLIVDSDSNAFCVVEDGDIFCLVHVTIFKFLFRPHVSHRKGSAQLEEFVYLKDHVAKIIKTEGLLSFMNAVSIREINGNVRGDTEAKSIANILPVAKGRCCLQAEKSKHAIDRVSHFSIIF